MEGDQKIVEINTEQNFNANHGERNSQDSKMDDQTFFAGLDPYLQQLEEEGYTILPDYVDRTTTAEIRDHLDVIIPMKLSGALEVLMGVNEIRHPIPGGIMVRLAGHAKTLQLARILLKSDDLRLREQILTRTDPTSPPYLPTSYHIDAPFLFEEYEATPRQIYFQMILYCNTVSPGGAPVMIIPRSHKLTYAVNQGARTEAERQALADNPLEVAGVNAEDAIEVCANEGDLLVFNAMCLHGSSRNRTKRPRYVYFTSFYDPSATWLVNLCRTNNYRDSFPVSLSRGLAPELHSMLEY